MVIIENVDDTLKIKPQKINVPLWVSFLKNLLREVANSCFPPCTKQIIFLDLTYRAWKAQLITG